jgi:hypothetical protein
MERGGGRGQGLRRRMTTGLCGPGARAGRQARRAGLAAQQVGRIGGRNCGTTDGTVAGTEPGSWVGPSPGTGHSQAASSSVAINIKAGVRRMQRTPRTWRIAFRRLPAQRWRGWGGIV